MHNKRIRSILTVLFQFNVHFIFGDIPVPCEFDSILFGLDVGVGRDKMGRKWNCVGYGGYLMDLKG